MKIILERGSWFTVTVSFNWYKDISYNPSWKRFVFFASSKPDSPFDHSYKEAKELSTLLHDFFDFDFYTEEGIDEVTFYPKQDCKITFKNS